ncbi:uncharacterized protein LOC114536938 isoform X1 [Dendronephthya gigantea]|uniref:uncharacterized protein LOC114536938 isoform X1 n=1 Tax=Dendronephthya gigantea TaxID=151771 RepID=UPI001069BC20|nr:uncharacterized protein LOC114536938 isoform X1 [Dendronephthya gigantea]
MRHNMILAFKISSIFFIALCFSFTTCINAGSYSCKKVECGCEYTIKNGTTYKISLEGISKKNKKVTVGYWTYYIDPCYGFSVSDTHCDDVRVCQAAKGGGSFPLARDIKNYGDYDADKKSVTVYYTPVPSQGKTRTVQLTVIEASAAPPDVQVNDVTFKITMKSPSLAPHKVQPSSNQGKKGNLSTGSILVITFFVVLVIYLVSGALFMKYRRGATGKEIVPNVDFWSSIPGLVKDGCVFFGKKMKGLCERCCNREGYNEI